MAGSSSFDVTTGVDYNEVQNAVAQAQKEITQRYDFKGLRVSIELNAKEKKLILAAPDDYKLKAMWEVLQGKLVRRQVTRVVTPGTAADSTLEAEQNNFLAAVCRASDGTAAGFAALDLSTGEFRATEFQGEDAQRRVEEELEQLRPDRMRAGRQQLGEEHAGDVVVPLDLDEALTLAAGQ